MGCAAFVLEAMRGKRGLNAEVAEVRAQSSLRRNGEAQERAGQARPLQRERLNGTDRGADAGGGTVVWGGVSADCYTAV